jgi:hypothetical protein
MRCRSLLASEEVMIKLAPFYPAIVVLIGAIFVAAGGFWASYRQSNFNMEIRAKNEEIAALQKDNADAITGGDSFAEAAFFDVGPLGQYD